MAKVVVNPESDLEPRPGDLQLTTSELESLALFKALSKPPSFEKYPGATLLRRYSQGDVICRQGDAGSTAYYILTSEDVLALNRDRLEVAQQLLREASRGDADARELAEQREEVEYLTVVVEQFESRVQQTTAPEGGPSRRRAATAHLLINLETKPRRLGVLGSLAKTLLGRGQREHHAVDPEFIPNDGPSDIDYHTRQAPMFEGEVFGEMSCMTLAPRSATVVADVDCFMLEFLRNIFDQVQKDPGYRERMDANYRERVLKNHLRRLEILHDLGEQDLDFIRDRAELLIVDPGTVICDEYDASDGVYIIRSGLVQVVTDLNAMLGVEEIADWQALCREIQVPDDSAPSEAES